MSGGIVPYTPGGVAAYTGGTQPTPGRGSAWRDLSPQTIELIIEGHAENTRRAYAQHLATFQAFCQQTGADSVPATPETLAEFVRYLCQERDYAPKSVELAISAVRTAHQWAGYPAWPDTRLAKLVLRAHRRRRAENGRRNSKQSPPITVPILRKMLDTCDLATSKGLRDRLVLVLGLALMGRRSELVALTLDDVRVTDNGLVVLIRTSKTDRDSKGTEVNVPRGTHPITDPVTAFQDWVEHLAEHGITEGRLLRNVTRHGHIGESLTPDAVNIIVKNLAKAAELPNAELYTAHSLRAGGATAAYEAGNPVMAISDHGRWDRKSNVVLQYIRAVDGWKNNPMRNVGL